LGGKKVTDACMKGRRGSNVIFCLGREKKGSEKKGGAEFSSSD